LRVPSKWTGVTNHPFFMNFSAVPWHVCAPLSHGSSTVDAVFRFVNNFAEQQIALSQVSFSAIGILHSDPKGGAATVGPMITWNGFGRPEPPWFLGPFKTNRERFLENIHVNMELIEEHDPVAAYLAQLEAKGSWSREVRNWKRKKAISTSSTRMTRPINFSPRTTNHVNIDWEWLVSAFTLLQLI